MSATETIALCAALAGPLGSLLEAAGNALKVSALVTIGQRLESVSVDLPKLWRGSRYTSTVAEMAKKIETEK